MVHALILVWLVTPEHLLFEEDIIKRLVLLGDLC